MKRSVAGLPSLITHRHVQQHYMEQTCQGGGRKKKKMRVSERERETEEEHVLTLPDRRVTKIPNKVNVIKVNWLQLDS